MESTGMGMVWIRGKRKRLGAAPKPVGGLLAGVSLMILLLCSAAFRQAAAQAPESDNTMDLGIIVVPTRADIDKVLSDLRAGMDFSVLAKERSTDATAVDGGYLGKVAPEQLRTELRRAIEGRKAGELTDVVQIPSGFAVVKIFRNALPTSDLDAKRISSLISRGAIHYGAPVAGQVEANAILQDFPKPEGWNRVRGLAEIGPGHF